MACDFTCKLKCLPPIIASCSNVRSQKYKIFANLSYANLLHLNSNTSPREAPCASSSSLTTGLVSTIADLSTADPKNLRPDSSHDLEDALPAFVELFDTFIHSVCEFGDITLVIEDGYHP